MITLSEEQLRKIEENKAAAIFKKQQALKKNNPASVSHNLISIENTSKGKSSNGKVVSLKTEPPVANGTLFLSATFSVISEDRFIVDMVYHAPSIEVFKTISGRMYDANLKKWSFPLSEHSTLATKLRSLKPEVIVNGVPDSVIKTLTSKDLSESGDVDWSKIDKVLRDSLMPFQVDGVRFGINKRGRCMIADDMGLGKTIQALGIAHYFKENWPLLIVCPSSMKFPWQEAIRQFLPSVESNIVVVTTGKGPLPEGNIVICSYDLMKNCCEELMRKKFGVIIFDESHSLKSSKTARTKVALELSSTARNVILLSGTPALSRPQELYSQIFAIDPVTFRTFYDFGIRYCDGKKDKFGWNFSGSSNLQELEVYLRKKIMIRRLKSEVIAQLPSKIRKLVVLNPSMVKSVSKQMQRLESQYSSQKGAEKQSTLLSYYSLTGDAKLNAVCEYIEDKLDNENKFLIFAHHTNVMNGICDLLIKKRVEHIRIDGSVSSELRKVFCDKFQNEDTCRVAVLSIKAANSGITLTAAQLVIFAELFWNPGELTQAEDRAHRIGQQDSVLIEYLVAKNTADDHLWRLIQTKLNILNKVGLSKDSFKDTDTKHMKDLIQPTFNQLTIESYLEGISDVSEGPSKPKDELFNSGMEDDDLFANINLEEIESEYQANSKKRKTDFEL